jgi:hypothetical protein
MAAMTRTRQAIALAITTVALAGGGAQARVTPQEAAALGTTLTAFGAEKGGSADGAIPPYSGGLARPPTGYKPGETRLIDPFADEKPVRVVTGSNVGSDTARLTEGTLKLLRRDPSFRLDVYPTHRTIAYPDWLLENTRRNATEARPDESGIGVSGVLAGIPFPIPKDGREVMWNHRIRYLGRSVQFKYDSWLVDGSGQRVLTSTAEAHWEFPVFEPKRTETLRGDEPLIEWKIDYSAPQRRAGEGMMLIDAVNPVQRPRHIWSYVPGQRRVKAVDMPDDALHGSSSGAYTNDDAFVYTGALERFDLKLLGKREMLVPYNTYRLSYHANPEDVLQPGHINPDLLRWELHRVWVVEATLKPGEHHAYSRRVFYVDEDSWSALASDAYDQEGKLQRAVFNFVSYDYNAGVQYPFNHAAYDFGTGAYFLAFFVGPYYGVRHVAPLPLSEWSPDSLAGAGVR